MRARGPTIVALLLLTAALTVLARTSMARTDGHLVYALDDAYIHLAIAKNLVGHGVWGLTPYEFTSASSSPLWTMLMGLQALVVPAAWQEAGPFAWNIVFGLALVIAAARALASLRAPAWVTALLLGFVVLATPIAPLAMAGMEHLLHAFLFLLTMFLAARALAGDIEGSPRSSARWCLLIAPLVVLARFESLFLLGVVAFLFLVRGRWRVALGLAVLALLPVAVFGYIQIHFGGFWLPNSLVSKSQIAGLSLRDTGRLLNRALVQATDAPWLGTLALAGIVCWLARLTRGARLFDLRQILLLLFVASATAHLLFANVGWFYRYEAYLIASGVVAVGVGAWQFLASDARGWDRRGAAPNVVVALTSLVLIGACGWTVCFLVVRAERAHRETAHASRHIYLQQYQMGRFLGQHYREAGVVANDVGAISFLAEPHLVDLLGLGTTEILRGLASGRARGDLVATLARERHAQLAVIYERWHGELPAGWTRVGSLSMNPADAHWNSHVVVFYAPTAENAATLAARLRAFAPSLPAGAFIGFDTPPLHPAFTR